MSSKNFDGPKTALSRYEALGFLYGLPLTNFIPGRKPTNIEVVRLWMHIYDKKRGNSWKLSNNAKNEVIKEIVCHLISNLESQHLLPMKEKSIGSKVKGVILKAEEFIHCKSKQIDNLAWIAQKRKLQDIEFSAEMSVKWLRPHGKTARQMHNDVEIVMQVDDIPNKQNGKTLSTTWT